MEDQIFYTKSWAYDISKDVISTGEVFDVDVIDQSIENIIATMLGERLFFPNFGSNIYGMLFETVNVSNGEKLLDHIIESIKNIEDRITISPNECTLQILPDTNSVNIVLKYKINETNEYTTFERRISP